MLAGELYLAHDPELVAARSRAQGLLARFNAAAPEDDALRAEVLGALLGGFGEGAVIQPPFRCDYGTSITIGARSFLNYDCVLLDCARITIGQEVQIAPGVHLYTATHPIEVGETTVTLATMPLAPSGTGAALAIWVAPTATGIEPVTSSRRDWPDVSGPSSPFVSAAPPPRGVALNRGLLPAPLALNAE